VERDRAVFRKVVEGTAKLIAQWQCVGWIHGVMNTDNMSIVNTTIDYGPYQWMDYYIPSSTSNTSDDQFRYAFERQRSIGKWNVSRLAESFAMMAEQGRKDEVLSELMAVVEEVYEKEFDSEYYGKMGKKLGVRGGIEEVKEWTSRWLSVMEATCADFTNSFRILSTLSLTHDNSSSIVDYLVNQSAPLSTLVQSVAPRIEPDQLAYYQHILSTRPEVKDSTGLIEGEQRRAGVRQQLASLSEEGKKERDRRLWSEFVAEYRTLMVKEWKGEEQAQRRRGMNSVNPKYVLRNWMAQVAIEKAEKGDYGECQDLLAVLRDPYAVEEDEVVVREGEEKGREVEEEKGRGRFTCKPPKDYENVLCSCSS